MTSSERKVQEQKWSMVNRFVAVCHLCYFETEAHMLMSGAAADIVVHLEDRHPNHIHNN